MIFVDSNIPMYLVGAAHPRRSEAQEASERLVAQKTRLVTDSEVFQEILHRYRSVNRPNLIQPAYESLLGLVDEVFPVELRDVERARDVLLATWRLSARDALHVAVMQRRGVRRILSFDASFDEVPGAERLP